MPLILPKTNSDLADFSTLTNSQLLSAHHRLFLKMQYYNSCDNSTKYERERWNRLDCQEQLDATLVLIQNRGLEPRIIRTAGIGMPMEETLRRSELS